MRNTSTLDRDFNDGYCEEANLSKDDIELLDDSEYNKFNIIGDESSNEKNLTLYSSLERSSLKSNIDDCNIDNKFCILIDDDVIDKSDITNNKTGFKVGMEGRSIKKNGNLCVNINKLVFERMIFNETKLDGNAASGYIDDDMIVDGKNNVNNVYCGYYYSKVNGIINYINIRVVNKFLPKMSREEYSKFLLAYTSYMILYSTRKPFSVVKLQIQDDLSLPTSVLGWIDTAFLGSYALGQLVLPSLFESTSISKYLCCSFVLSSLSSLVFGLSRNSISLLFSWFLNGLFHAGAYPMLVKYLIQCFGLNNRGKILSVWTTSQQLGAIISTGFSASICSKLGWRYVFYIPSVIVFAFGIFIYKYLRHPSNSFKYEESVKIIMMKDTNKINNSEYLNGNYSDQDCYFDNISSSVRVNDIYSENSFRSYINTSTTLNTTNCNTSRDELSNKLMSSSTSSMVEGGCIEDDGNDEKFHLNYAIDSEDISLEESCEGLKKTLKSDLSCDDLNKLFAKDTSHFNSELSPTKKNKYKRTAASDKVVKLGDIESTQNGLIDNSFKENETNNTCTSFYNVDNDENIDLSEKIKLLFKIKSIFNISICYFFVKLIRYSLLFWLPYYLIRVLNYDPSVAGYSSMLFDIGGIMGAISAGSIADSVFSGRRIIVAFYMTIMISFSIVNFIIITIFKVNFLILFGIMLMGFCISGPDSILGSTATQDILDNSGLKTKSIDSLATGIVNGLGSLGAVAQGTLTAYISEYYGWNSLFSCLILFSTSSFFILLPIALNKRNH
ncbi:sugar phosphate permease [Cryptosporidium xiaoi]|uniref:Sugar phosphate permease n=1 Tax=Cryptosporidium xiaoi TaxID=659607 RepID=A0AAV9Y2V7_9CRYT